MPVFGSEDWLDKKTGRTFTSREYKSRGQYDRGVRKMIAKGWTPSPGSWEEAVLESKTIPVIVGFYRTPAVDPGPTLDESPVRDTPPGGTAQTRIDHLERVQSVALAYAQSLDEDREADSTGNAKQNPPTTREEWLTATDAAMEILTGIAEEARGICDALRQGRDPQPEQWSPDIAGDQEAVRKVLTLLHSAIADATARAAKYADQTAAMASELGTPAQWRAAQASFVTIAEGRFNTIGDTYFPDP